MIFSRNRNFYLATSTLIGTIIGAGMFGIPYAFSKSGFLVGLGFLILLTALVTIFHLYYGEVVLRTSSKHRLVGYAEKYFGKKGRITASFSLLFGFNVGLLVYMLLGGAFLHNLFGEIFGGTPFLYSLIFFVFCAFFIFHGLKLVSRGEFFLTLFLLIALVVIIFRGLFYFDLNNLETISLEHFFLPYGVILFALGGGAAIPELQGILSREKKKMKKVIIFGSVTPAIMYALFAFSIIGATGEATSPEALDGLHQVIGDGVAVLGSAIGFLAVVTSFLVIGLNLKETYHYDYHFPHFWSWILALFIPLALFLGGLHNFILMMSLVGAFGSAIDGVLIVAMYRKAKENGDRRPEFTLDHPRWLSYSVPVIFIIGAVYEIIFQLKA